MRRLIPASPVEESALARGFAWAAFLVACAAIAVYGGTYPVPLLAAGVAAAGHRTSWRLRHRRRSALGQALIAGLMFACLAYFVTDSVGGLFGGNLPQANFVMLLVAVTSFALTTRRNLYSSMWMSLALIYLAAVFAWDLWFLAFAAAWVACLGGFWASAHLARIKAGRPRLPSRPLALGLVATLAVGTGLFWLLPQPAASPSGPLVISLPSHLRLQGEVENPALPLVEFGSDSSGATDNVSLRYRGRLGDETVFYVRTGAPAYWRGLVFDQYRNGTWTARYAGTRGSYHPYVEARDLPPAEGPQLGAFVQTFRIVRSMPGVVYAAAPVQSIYYPAQALQRDSYGDWFVPGAHRAGTVYSVVSYLPDFRPASLKAPPPPGAFDLVPGHGPPNRTPAEPDAIADYAQYTDAGGLSERARELARRYAAGVAGESRYDLVMAVTQGLQRDYRYSLELGHAPAGQDPIDWFLFDARIGYCEQFATTATLMLRSLGVPARLATGYGPGEYSPQLDQTIVRERDAHAWVEVYFPGHGWVPLDPSPGFPALAATRFPDRWAASGLARLIPHLTIGGPAAVMAPLGALALLPGSAAILVLLALLLAWTRRRLRPALPGGERELLAIYGRFQRRLGMPRGPAETPREYLARAPAAAREVLGELTEAVSRGAYADRWPSPAELARLRALTRRR